MLDTSIPVPGGQFADAVPAARDRAHPDASRATARRPAQPAEAHSRRLAQPGPTSLTSAVASVTPRPNLTRRVTCSHGLPATAGLADADHEFLEGLRDHLAILRTVPV